MSLLVPILAFKSKEWRLTRSYIHYSIMIKRVLMLVEVEKGEEV